MAIRVAVLMMSLVLVRASAFGNDCASCHAPAVATSAQSPRWNRATQSGVFTLTASVSATCLACHDGTSARAMHARDNHPVGIDYERVAAEERAFLRLSSSPSGLGGTIADDLLVQGRIECTSCHDPHAAHGSGTTTLRVNNDGSRLCLTCHDR